jgi:CDP-diacylglycerol--glycerol-3-phosphate 3-phosphatidyltransferase/archaetidylinositol phosphate synthase
MLSSLLYFFYPLEVYGFTTLGWMILVIAIGSHITALQRVAHIWKELS